MTLVKLQQITDQLSELFGLKENEKVCALINPDEPNDIKGWCLVNVEEDGKMVPITTTFKTLTNLMDNFNVNCSIYQ